MKRPARLKSAKSWIPTCTGKNLVSGYCKHYAVDWRCAVIELTRLGIQIDPAYIAMRERTDAEHARQREARKEKRNAMRNQHWHPYTDTFSAYLAGDYPALYDLEMREMYGEDWEKEILKKQANRDDLADEECQYEIDASQTYDDPTIGDSDESDDWVPF